MSIEGTWELVIASPTGKQYLVLELSSMEGLLRGLVKANGRELELTGLEFDGSRLTWVQRIMTPMPIKLVVDLAVDGDTMSGTAKAGRLMRSKVEGARLSPTSPLGMAGRG